MQKLFIGLIVTYVVLTLEAGSSEGQGQHENFIKWARPPMFHSHNEPLKPKQIQNEAGVHIMRTIRRYVLENEQTVVPKLTRMLRKLDYRSRNSNQIDAMSNETFQCPRQNCPPRAHSTKGVRSLKDTWLRLVHQLKTQSEDCEPCVTLWSGLKTLSCPGILTWETIRGFLLDTCHDLLPEASYMCEVLSLQGQHVFCIILELEDTRDFCEMLNECYPTDTRPDRPDVSERTPWAVRDAMLREGKVIGSTRNRRVSKHPRGADDDLIMVAQLSDIHMQSKHLVGAPSVCPGYICCSEESIGVAPARKWGEYKCNIPPRTVSLFLDRVQKANPDFVLYVGDSPPHTMWDETKDSQLNCSQLVVDLMKNQFGPNLRVYPAIGNHEMYPTNLFSTDMADTMSMMESFATMWQSLADFKQLQMDTMKELAYYTMLVEGHLKLRIVTINSNHDWYKMNFYATLNHERDDVQKTWLNETLTNARTADEKVIIISHHPIALEDTQIRTARWWETVINAFHDVIVLHVSGHTHREEAVLSFEPETMAARSVNLAGGSTASNTFINPSMKVFYLNATNYALVDYEIFYLDIKTQNDSMGVPPAIVYKYSAKDEYGMDDLSPDQWKQLVVRFIDDDALFHTYYDNRDSGATSEVVCDYDCKVEQMCGMWFAEHDEKAQCMELAPSAPPPPPSASPPTTPQVDGADVLVHSAILLVVGLLLTRCAPA